MLYDYINITESFFHSVNLDVKPLIDHNKEADGPATKGHVNVLDVRCQQSDYKIKNKYLGIAFLLHAIFHKKFQGRLALHTFN